MKWFTNVRTVEELRKQYRQLMKKHHPDVGGSTEDAKQINAEYDTLAAFLSRQEATQEKKAPPPRTQPRKTKHSRPL